MNYKNIEINTVENTSHVVRLGFLDINHPEDGVHSLDTETSCQIQ